MGLNVALGGGHGRRRTGWRSLPRRIQRVRVSIASHAHRSLPNWQEGRHPHCHFSEPVQASLALRPVGSLPKVTFVASLRHAISPAKPLLLGPNRCPGGTLLHRRSAPQGRLPTTDLRRAIDPACSECAGPYAPTSAPRHLRCCRAIVWNVS